MKFKHSLKPHSKINSKQIKDLNVKDSIQILLEENTGRALFDGNCSNILLYPPLRLMKIKAKIKNCDLIKMKSFCIAKETINKMKTAHTTGGHFCKWWDWQGVNLQNTQTLHTAQYLNNKQHNQKVAEDLNRHFSKEGTQMAKRHMKICSTTLII